MKRSSLLAAVAVMLLQGCTSFYSGAILGHDANVMPLPERNGTAVVTSLGASLKVAPTTSIFTKDSTQSVQATVTLQNAVPISPNARFVFEAGLGGYFAQNNI